MWIFSLQGLSQRVADGCRKGRKGAGEVKRTQTSLTAEKRLLHLYSNLCSSSLVILVILVFGSVFQNTGELHIVEVAFFVNRCFSVHLIHFLICKTITHCGKELT